MKKVLLIQTQNEAGGAQRVSMLLSKGLRADGIIAKEVFFYNKTGAYSGEFVSSLLPNSKLSVFDLPRLVIRLVRYLRSEKPDAVILFQHWGCIIGSVAAKICGIKIVIANQSGLPNAAGIPRVASLLDLIVGCTRLYSFNIVNSDFTKKAFSTYPKPYRNKLREIKHGVEISALSDHSKNILPAVDDSKFLKLLSAGRLVEQKNHIISVRALTKATNSVLYIAGDGPLKADILNEASALNVSDRVVLLGEVSPENMANLINECDVFVFPSIWETFGMAVVEAAISGLPVVCSKLDVLKEVLKVESFPDAVKFFDPEDSDVLSDILVLLEDSKFTSKIMVDENYADELAEKYSVLKMAKKYSDLID
jgi:D-inositol-3-phosphate glycosyltransferase